jgi:hypothetical protein
MTSHVGRLYTASLGLVVFFLAWVVVAAQPWGATGSSTRQLAVLQAQLQSLRKAASSAPRGSASVRVVNLPPLTITRTS